MAHYDIFREQLAIKYPAYGHALWEPNPGELYNPVEVGDVGYVRGGKFHRLFNALLPADHPSHRTFGVPEYHEPLTPNSSRHIDTGTLKPNHYCSSGVSVTAAATDVFASAPEDLPQVSYLCRRRQRGAALFLPVPARRLDTIAHGAFGQWMIKHIDRWFAFTRHLELGIEQMEDIILVTGCHRARSWANIAFLENQEDAQVSFGVEVTNLDRPGTNINWRFSPERSRGAVLSWGPGGKDLPEDQCIFIRGFRVTRLLRILPKHLIAAAEPSSDPDEYDSESDVELKSIPTITKYRDPLHVLLEHITERAPDCDMVLVHDDDLARIEGICDSPETLQSESVIHLLQVSQPKVQQVRCASYVDECKKVTKVAMFSEEFQKWGETRDKLGIRELPTPSVRPTVESPPLSPLPSQPSPENTEPALLSSLIEALAATSLHAQSQASAPQGGSRQTSGGVDARSQDINWPAGERDTRLSKAGEVGSRNTTVLPHRLAASSMPVFPLAPTSLGNQNDVLSWTSQDPRQSLLFTPFGIVYRFHTETNAQGQSTTTVWRAIRPNKEDRVAKLEWAIGGGLGRAVIGKSPLPMADLVRRDPRMPSSRVFNGPDGSQYRWRPSTTNQDIVLEDPRHGVIALVRPIRPTRYQGLGDVYAELHFIRSACAHVMHPPMMDAITVTAMLYRFASAFNL